MKGFLSALTYPFKGVGYFIQRPVLWKYAIASFVINLFLFAAFAVLFIHYRSVLVSACTPARFPLWLRDTLGWILTGVLVIAGLFLFTVVGNWLATPFLDAMTERILRELGETLPATRGLMRSLFRGLVNQSFKLFFFTAVQVFLLLLWMTPLGFLHPPLSAVLGVLFLGFEYLDYPLDARRVPVPNRFAWLFQNLGTTLGFGLPLFGILWIPLVGYLCLPLAVSGATLLAHNIDSGPSRR